jgi:hypothetical protein
MVFTIHQLEEEFQYDVDSESMFMNEEEKSSVIKRWDLLKEKLGWNGMQDLHDLMYLKRYAWGYLEEHLTPSQLEECLKNNERFHKNDIMLTDLEDSFTCIINLTCLGINCVLI